MIGRMKKQKRDGVLRMLLSILPLLMLCGCIAPRLENTDRLMKRQDFSAAANAAPRWVEDALKTIAALEHEIERGD